MEEHCYYLFVDNILILVPLGRQMWSDLEKPLVFAILLYRNGNANSEFNM